MKQLKNIKFVYHQKKKQIIEDLNWFKRSRKMKYQKVMNVLDTKSDNTPRFITKTCSEVHD